MNTPKRNLLEKEKFLQGMRQQWMAVLLIWGLIILTTQIIFHINPEPYMDFALTLGSLFILGGSVDSYMKISAARSIKEKEINKIPE